jgi:hypothetical protein
MLQQSRRIAGGRRAGAHPTTARLSTAARAHRRVTLKCSASSAAPSAAVKPEAEVPGMSAYLDSLRWSKDGLIPAIAQVCDVVYLMEVSLLHTWAADTRAGCFNQAARRRPPPRAPPPQQTPLLLSRPKNHTHTEH